MSELDDKVDRWDHDYLQEQVWDLQRELEQLRKEFEKLTERLENLEPRSVYPAPPLLDSVKCVKCGMIWSNMMGYVCQDINCPVQLKVTC